jgi:hypothetical protein
VRQIFLTRGPIVNDTYLYHPQILEELAGHGLKPRPSSPPDRLRDAVRDLYKYEIRRLRGELLAGRFLKSEYAGHIIELRKRYWVLSVPIHLWVVTAAESGR